MKHTKIIVAVVLTLTMLLSLASCGAKSAYDVAVENGYTGSESQWLNSLKGEKGDKGATGAQGEQGEKGEQGEQGEQGIQGVKGDQGDQGVQGIQGVKGDKGDQGVQGIQGEKGDKGDQGVQGPQGEKGDKGDQGVQGPQGEKGDKGDQGVQGIQGEKGDAGADGKSAYELYRDTYGYTGTEEEWLADLVSGQLVEYTVTFDLNGGTAVEGFQQSVTVPGDTLLTLSIPTREGYTFSGWYTGETVNDGLFTTTTPVKSNFDLIAKWQINEVTVTFLDNLGNTLKVEKVNYGASATAPTAPTVDKLYFSAWDCDFSAVTTDLTVKPIYLPNTYTMTYHTHGGSEIAQEIYYVGDVPVKPGDPTKEGHYFIGWYSDAAYINEYRFDTAFTENTTIYAYFSESIPIYTADDLKAIGDYSSSKYYLANDIDLGGEQWTPLWYFSGELNGEGHKIHNFTITSSDYLAGFFTTNSGTIKNVTFSDFVFTVSSESQTFTAGAIVGNNSGTIENCHVTDATITYSYICNLTGDPRNFVGGLVGENQSILSSCTITADINTYIETNNTQAYTNAVMQVGGIAGNNSGTIQKIQTEVHITYTNTGSYHGRHAQIWLGAAVSDNNGIISHCDVNTTITGVAGANPYSIRAYAGGFVYSNHGNISSCHASGSLEIPSGFNVAHAGGFALHNHNTIKDCYTNVEISVKASAITDSVIGGFVGENKGTISSCYTVSHITTSAQGAVGGFAGKQYSGATISKCFCAGNITVSISSANLGYFVGSAESGSTLFKSYYNSDMVIKSGSTVITPSNTDGIATTVAALQSSALLVDILSWSTDVWEIVAGAYPTLK